MLDAHTGMNVSEQEFLAVVDDMMEAMTELGYDQSVRNEVPANRVLAQGRHHSRLRISALRQP